ncbi:hypothetical protein [Methylobacterium mesophilicum]
MSEKPTIPQHPKDMGARARRDYAQRAALEHRDLVRGFLSDGVRTSAGIADRLNQLRVPSSDRSPWDTARTGRLLRRLGISWVEVAQQDAEAIREQVEELWAVGYRARPQLALALTRRGIPAGDRLPWTAYRVGKLISRLGLDWSESAPRLRRGDSVPETIEVPGVAELMAAIEAPAAPQEVEAPKPIEAAEPPPPPTQRRRSIRA